MTALAKAALPDAAPADPDLAVPLRQIFGFDTFRPLQQDVVRAAMAGQDVLVVMPTGSGKSLCFQMPAALTSGVTVVISPLVALMRDQIDALRQKTEFGRTACAYLNSLQSGDEQREVLARLRGGALRLLYIAPERFRSAPFIEALRQASVARLVVDEAHCISEWGHDFRPDYLALKDVVATLGRPPLMAVTATATRQVQNSIVANLGMLDPAIYIGGFDRPNLHFAVIRCKSETDRAERLTKALPKLAAMGGSGLIYVATRKQAEQVAGLAADALAPRGARAAAYHAGMDVGIRNQLQHGWITGSIQVLVATNAFGMGIDKSDVRFVVHYVYPESLESYYQEAGRAGRDGRKSRCVVLYNFADRRTREWFIDNDALTSEDLRKLHQRLCHHWPENALKDDGVARVPRAWWAHNTGWTELRARLALGELERAGLVERVGDSTEETLLRIVNRDFPPRALEQIAAGLERQRDERYRRLDEMMSYCKTTSCRRRTTLDYFGDPTPPVAASFCCDNCDGRAAGTAVARPRRESADAPPMPRRVDAADPHSVLQALDALRPQLGKARLVKLLQGSGDEAVSRFQHLPLFGAFQGRSRKVVEAYLQRLMSQGLLRQGDEDDYFVCSVTGAGRAAWQQKIAMSNGAPLGPKAADGPLNATQAAFFEALRRWRREQATEAQVPPYCVLSDATLREISRSRPASLPQLLAITGIGEVKAALYGEVIIGMSKEEIS